MAADDLIDYLGSLNLRNQDYSLPFNPPDDIEFDPIPRYLFRVFDKRSDGVTSRTWASSKDVKAGKKDASTDIFERKSARSVAAMLNRHLGWCGREQDADNFVSWTSSMLFALRYMLFRHTRYRIDLSKVYLCIVDTTALPSGAFARDMDLLDCFLEYDSNLTNFKLLRSKRHREYSGSFYFGEYLSQGALRIEGNCDIVSAQAMIDQGLFILRPELAEYGAKTSTLANEVIRLREKFVRSKELGHIPEASFIEINAAMEVAELFQPRWRMPIAASMLALRPRRKVDDAIIRAFRAPLFSKNDADQCAPGRTATMAYHTLPEVKQFDSIIKSVHMDSQLTKAAGFIGVAEASLRTAMANLNDLELHSMRDSDLVQNSREYLLQRLHEVSHLAKSLERNVQITCVVPKVSLTFYDDGDSETGQTTSGSKRALPSPIDSAISPFKEDEDFLPSKRIT